MSSKDAQTKGRLRARPAQVTGAAPVGLQPLVLLLHGAGGHPRQGLDLLLRSLADAAGLLLLAPASRDRTWDLLVGRRYGDPDLAMIDRAPRASSSATARATGCCR